MAAPALAYAMLHRSGYKPARVVVAGFCALAVAVGAPMAGIIIAVGGTRDPAQTATSRPATAPVRAPATANQDVVTIGTITINIQIVGQVQELLQAADAAGIALGGSGYRTHQQQIALREAHCGPGHHNIYVKPASECSPPTARPGASRHEQGLAIDFTCNDELISNRTNPCYQWLATHAVAYGLHELRTGAEPWHWSVDGT